MKAKVLLVSVAAILASCASTDISPARQHYESGEFAEAALVIAEIHPQDEEGNSIQNRAEDNIWLLLEKGKMLMDAGYWEESLFAYEEAAEIFDALDAEAQISLGAIRSGAGALLLDDRQSDYVGTTYDKILLRAYMCLTQLMLGDVPRAVASATAASAAESDAAEARAVETGRIAAMDEEAAAKDENGNLATGVEVSSSNAIALQEGKFQSRPQEYRTEEDPESIQALIDSFALPASEMAASAGNDYAIPFARFVGALALAANGDRNMAEATYLSVPGAPSVGPGQERTAYVLFECGSVPKREDRTFSFWYAYPAKVKRKDGTEEEVMVPSRVVLPFVGLGAPSSVGGQLKVTAGSESTETTPIGDVSAVVAQEYRDALPGMLARIAIRAVIQEVAQILVNEQVGGWGVLAGAVAKGFVEPDLRGWESLGAQHQVAAVRVPDDGRITLELAGGGAELPEGAIQSGLSLDIEVPVGPPVLVYVRATTLGNFIAHSCALVPAAPAASSIQ